MQIIAVIPARYASSRLPGKALIPIGGVPMIKRVVEQALKASHLNAVYVATDDHRIFEYCDNEKMEVIMTSDEHESGTSRVAEVAASMDAEVIINLQGDEPFINPAHIDRLAQSIVEERWDIATLCTSLIEMEGYQDPNCVKVVKAIDQRAMYFSRASIPYFRNRSDEIFAFLHLGIYAFRAEILQRLVRLPRSPLETKESLEQLRWLENGYNIGVIEVEEAGFGIDTMADVEKAEALLNLNG